MVRPGGAATDDHRPGAPDGGFTLIELMIVMVVLGILAGITIFAVGSFRSDANNAACKTDVRTIATANAAYAVDHPGLDAPSIDELVQGHYITSTPSDIEGCTELAFTPPSDDPPSGTRTLNVVAIGTTFHGAVNDPAFDAHVTVTVTDQSHVVVQGAEVTGTWNDPGTTHTTCTTDAHGTCPFTTTLSTSNASVNVTWTMSAVTKTDYAQAPGSVTLRCSRRNNANDTRACT